jgi:tetratricopeptide (TPR) repeat protein
MDKLFCISKVTAVFCFVVFLSLAVLIETGVSSEYYIGQHYQAVLEQEIQKDPQNYVALYYLGMINLQVGDKSKAIEEWEQCLALAPESAKMMSLRERLVILKIQKAREEARTLISKKAAGSRFQVKDATIAVLNYNVEGIEGKEAISKGLASMIITDLSHVPGLTVVERAKIQALQDETRLSESGLVDPKQAASIGEMALAGRIVRGRLAGASDGNIDIASSVVLTAKGEDLGEKHLKGNLDCLFVMEKDIVAGILETLGINIDDLPPEVISAINKVHTRDEEAFINYSLGLDALDKGKFGAARGYFQKAAQIDPGFGLARDNDVMNMSDGASDYIDSPGYFDYMVTDIGEFKKAETGSAGMDFDWVSPPETDPIEAIPPEEDEKDIIGPVPAFPVTP